MANPNPGGEKAALFLEDLRVGQRFLSSMHRIDEEQIRAFAEQFDPQPFHLDAEAAKATLFGGLVAIWMPRGNGGNDVVFETFCETSLMMP
jgi:acyl dehydratase